jgi:CcmD family protein
MALAAAIYWSAVGVLAQGQPAQDGFVPVTNGDLGQEQLPATPLVFAAYAFVWLVLLTYVFTLWRRISRVERELADVHTQLKARRP